MKNKNRQIEKSPILKTVKEGNKFIVKNLSKIEFLEELKNVNFIVDRGRT